MKSPLISLYHSSLIPYIWSNPLVYHVALAFFFSGQHHMACGILVTRPGMEPMLPVMEAQRPPWNSPCGSILKTYLESTTSHHLQHYQLVQNIVIPYLVVAET